MPTRYHHMRLRIDHASRQLESTNGVSHALLLLGGLSSPNLKALVSGRRKQASRLVVAGGLCGM